LYSPVRWFAVAGGCLLATQWVLLTLFFVRKNEAADRASNVVAIPALIAIGVSMGAVLDRFAEDVPVVASVVTGIGLLAVTVNLGLTVALVLEAVPFPRIAMPATLSWAVLFLWIGAASVLIVAEGRLPAWLGWIGIGTIAYAIALLAVIMRNPEVRTGVGVPSRAQMAAGAPILVLIPLWFVLLGVNL